MTGVEIEVRYSPKHFMDVEQRFSAWFGYNLEIETAIDLVRDSVKKAVSSRAILVTIGILHAGEKPKDYIRYKLESDFKGSVEIEAGEIEGHYFNFNQKLFKGKERTGKRELVNFIEQELKSLNLKFEQLKEQELYN